MISDFYGETEITPEELYEYSKGATRRRQFVVNFLLLFGIGIIGWVVIPPAMESFGFVAQGYKDAKDESGFAGVVVDSMISSRRVKLTIALGLIAFVILKVIYRFILKPLTLKIFHRSSFKYSAVADAWAGKVVYKIDKYGLEYNIESSKATNKFKLYWRNFTDAEYAPEIIRLYTGKKQKAFILMRAFAGNERTVGQFVESEINKVKKRNEV